MKTDSRYNPYSVSVVIPAYNAAEHISRALDSVLAQTLLPDEIIVVDDGSADDTQQVVQKYLDRVIYIYQSNSGVSAARNTGIEAARSEWIAFLDSDDEWYSEKLHLQIELLKNHPSIVWASSNYDLCLCSEHRTAARIAPEKALRLLNGKDYHDDYFEGFDKAAVGWTGTMLVKKSVLTDVDMFSTTLPTAEDLDLWFRIAYRHPEIVFLPQPLATYHLSTPESLTKTDRRMAAEAAMAQRHVKNITPETPNRALKKCLSNMVTLWIRGLLFQNKPDDIRMLLKEFGHILSPGFKLLVKVLMISPKNTARCCHAISKVVRRLKLRKQLLNPPPPIQD